MSLDITLIDRDDIGNDKDSRWTLTRPGETVLVELTWSDRSGAVAGERDEPRPPPRVYLRYNQSYEWSEFDAELVRERDLVQVEGKPADWHTRLKLQAPPFWPMSMQLALHTPDGRSLRTRIRLIPRASFICSVAIIMVALALATYASMRVSASMRVAWQDALLGVGKLSLLGVLGAMSGAVAKRARPGGVPWFGVMHMLPRAAAASVLALVALFVFVRTRVISVANQTEATVELKDGGWEKAEPLPTREAASFLLSPSTVADNFANYISQADRFCPQVLEPGAPEWRSLGDCEPDTPPAGLALGRLGFSPTLVHLHCRKLPWTGLIAAHFGDSSRPDELELDANTQRAWLVPSATCELPGQVLANLRIERFDRLRSSGVEGTLTVSYPWTPTRSHENAQLAVDMTQAPTMAVRLRVEDQHTSKPTQPGALLATQLDVDRTQQDRPTLPVPAGVQSPKLSIGVGVGREPSDFSPEATLSCNRGQSSETHFRAVGLILEHSPALIRELTATAKIPTVWSSTWSRDNESAITTGTAWLCAAAPGSGPDGPNVGNQPFGLESLDIDVKLDRLGTQLRLEIPAEWMARQITISSEGKRLGTLSCAVAASEGQRLVHVAPVWIHDHLGRDVENHVGVKLESIGTEHDGMVWSADWEPAQTDQSAKKVAPAWGCWPAFNTEHDGAGERTQVTVYTGDGEAHSGDFHAGSARVDLDKPKLKLCWQFERDVHASRPKNCDKTYSDRDIEAEYFEVYRNERGCDRLLLCDEDGGAGQ